MTHSSTTPNSKTAQFEPVAQDSINFKSSFTGISYKEMQSVLSEKFGLVMGVETLYNVWDNETYPQMYNQPAPAEPVYSACRFIYLLHRTPAGSVAIYRLAGESVNFDGDSQFTLLEGAAGFLNANNLDASNMWKHLRDLQAEIFEEEKAAACEKFTTRTLMPALKALNLESPITPTSGGFRVLTPQHQTLKFIVDSSNKVSASCDLSIKVSCHIGSIGCLFDYEYEPTDPLSDNNSRIAQFVKNCVAMAHLIPDARSEA
jgi:hypothetical protein